MDVSPKGHQIGKTMINSCNLGYPIFRREEISEFSSFGAPRNFKRGAPRDTRGCACPHAAQTMVIEARCQPELGGLLRWTNILGKFPIH